MVQNDVKDGVVNLVNLKNEIANSPIRIVCDEITVEGDSLLISFRAPILPEEETLLNTILLNHDSTQAPILNTTFFQQELVPTGGKSQTEAKYIWGEPLTDEDISNNITEKVTEIDWVQDHPVNVMLIRVRTEAHHDGDAAQLYITPPNLGMGEGTICQPTQDVSTSDTVIHLPGVVLAKVYVGDYLYLSDGINTDSLGHIVSINKTNGTVTMSTPATHNFVAEFTVVKHRLYIISKFEFGPPDQYIIGSGKLTGSYLPTGMIARIVYINRSTTRKRLYTMIEYLE